MLLFDVDGVLSPATASDPADRGTWWDDPTFVRAWGLPVWYSPTLVETVNALCRLPGVSAQWLTTWGHAAAEEFAPAVGLDAREWPVRSRPDEGPQRWWKAAEAAEVLAETTATGELVIWCEDDIEWWAEENTGNPHVTALLTHPRLVTFCPDRYAGLLARDLDRLTRILTPDPHRSEQRAPAPRAS